MIPRILSWDLQEKIAVQCDDQTMLQQEFLMLQSKLKPSGFGKSTR